MAKTRKALPELKEYYDFFSQENGKKAMHGLFSQQEKDYIQQLYVKLFHSPMPRTCNNCVSDAFFEIYNVLKSRPESFTAQLECEYLLKGGVVLQMFGNSDNVLTNKNITNALAELHLKENQAKAKYFTKLPSDWKDRLG